MEETGQQLVEEARSCAENYGLRPLSLEEIIRLETNALGDFSYSTTYALDLDQATRRAE